MLECGTVIKIKKNDAVVRIMRGAACGSCRACGISENKPHVDITVANACSAEAGDTVELELGNSAMLKASVICYLLPLVPALLLTVLTALLSLPDWTQIVGFFVGLAIGFVCVFWIEKRLAKKTGLGPKMTQIVKKSGA